MLVDSILLYNTLPTLGLYNPKINLTKVVFPLPLGPTKAIVSPSLMLILIFLTAKPLFVK